MKTSTKIFIALLAAGLIVCFAGFAMANFDLRNLNDGGAYEKKIYLAQEPVVSVRVDARDAHISLARAEEGEGFKAEYEENSRHFFEAKCEDGIFSLVSNRQNWYERIFRLWLITPRVTLYLDSESYEEISLVTGNGKIRSGLSLAAASLHAQSGNGDVEMENIGVSGDAVVTADNGDVSLKNVSAAGSLTARTSNGDVALENVSAAGSLRGETNNGSVRANALTAAEIFLKTDNGGVNGYFLSASKSVELRTNNGSVRGSVKGRREDFLIRAKTSNGKNNLFDTDAGDKKLTVRTGNGSIEVSFYD